MNDKDLKADADAVQYEINMLEFTAITLNKCRYEIKNNIKSIDLELLHHALLESFLLHCRNLRDFLCKKESNFHPDDVLAVKFLSCEVDEWEKSRPKLSLEQNDEKDRLDKLLAHISSRREDYIANGQSGWPTDKIYNEIIDGLTVFKKSLPDDRKNWFIIPPKILVAQGKVMHSTSSENGISISRNISKDNYKRKK